MPFRDIGMACPHCGTRLEGKRTWGRVHRRCPTCRGSWVEQNVVAALFSEMRYGAAPVYRDARSTERARPCPQCSEPMGKSRLEGILVDVCEQAHGVWFDHHELAQALENVGTGERRDARVPESFPSLLDQFFSGRSR